MSRIAQAEDFIIARCESVAGEYVRVVEDLPGTWTQRILRSAFRNTPGVYVAWGGGRPDGNSAHLPQMRARFVVYVVTSHASGERARRRGNNRQVGAYEILELIIPALHGKTIPDLGTLQYADVENLYNDEFDKQGVVIYGAVFELPIGFDALGDINDLANFERLDTVSTMQGLAAEGETEMPQEE